MNKRLVFQALFKFLLGVVLVGLLVFIPAGSIYFFNGWLFMVVLFIPIFITGIILMFKNPKLLASRLDGKEKQKKQGIIVRLSGLMFMSAFILAGLDYRFCWTYMPKLVSYISGVVLLLSYMMWSEVLRENIYLSRTIKVEENQKVISTGLYGVVRHPMYLATLILFLSMPLVLGSLISFFVFLIYPVLIIIRIIHEENFLEKELAGYREYKQKVKYRLIPFIW